jgi:hypothetical protein
MDDDGDGDFVWGPNNASQIGRVPYETLGIDDLRDASGERLWYALSHDFRKLRCSGGTVPPNCTVINSDTQGQLTVVGIAPATQVVAVLFAPGEALQGQIRDPANATAHNDPRNYLEGPPNLDDPVNINYVFTSAVPSDTFNDRVLVITKAELMAAVEPVVAANIQRDIGPLLQAYFNKWGAYPFAVPLAAGGPPSTQSSYQGVSPQTFGLLPLTDSAPFAWASASVTQLVGHPMQTGTPTVTSSSCSTSSSPSQAVCQVNYCCDNNDRPVVALQIFLGNANSAFADIPSGTLDASDPSITMVDMWGNLLVPSAYGYWSDVAPVFPPTRTFVARSAGGALTYIGRLRPAGAEGGRVTITVPLPSPAGTNYLPIISGNPGPGGVNPNPTGAWFIANQWYKQTFYAVSPGFAPGGVPLASPATCSPLPATPSCLKVNNLPAPFDNKNVILVLAGRALDGQTHPSPSGNPGDYLEGQNATPADLIFEHRAGTPTTINDRVVVVSP